MGISNEVEEIYFYPISYLISYSNNRNTFDRVVREENKYKIKFTLPTALNYVS